MSDLDKVYRGVVVTQRMKPGGPVREVTYLKPYNKIGSAKASVTRFRNESNYYRNQGIEFIDGWVEIASDWDRIT